ncbi:MAG: DEAD/DEAH box helicase [Gemmatimonadaceae bacterium]|nr:DEAD/DEAH box helicase [Gemmatimonadaceae bacterium]
MPSSSSAGLGDITLLPHQRDAVSRITRIIADHRGALLADEVGMGKTYVALGVARQYQSVQVIAPAALLPMWRTACSHAGMAHAQCHSMHTWSTSIPPTLVIGKPALVIIDEAHHLRNPATQRYRRIAEALVDCDVLLLSATPIHNRPRDLHAIISLFRGDREDNIAQHVLSQLIVRRRQHDLNEQSSTQDDQRPGAVTPTILTHPPLSIPQDRETLSRILALPAPLPAHDGAVAGALIRLGLLRAWCSSDAELTLALTKRRLRGEALHDALREGRHPTREELRHWVVGDDAGQLAFPELLVSHTTESGPLIEVLQKHLDAVGELARHHARSAEGDPVRAGHLRALLEEHHNVPIVAFSQYTHTINALFRALSDIAGIGSISGRRACIASGPLPREELLALFAPRASGRPPPPDHMRVRLLLTTDLLAEGVNLQDAGVVVHLDLPWTNALRVQRVGRVARIGSLHSNVHVYRLRPNSRVADALRAEQRIIAKRHLGVELIGADIHRAHHRSAADWRTALLARLQRWDARSEPDSSSASFTRAPRIPFAILRMRSTPTLVALALVTGTEMDGTSSLLAIVRTRTGWRVSQRSRVLSQVAKRLEAESDVDTPKDGISEVRALDDARGIERIVDRWINRARIRMLTGPGPEQLPLVTQQLLRRLDQCHRQWSTIKRAQYGALIAAARYRARSAQGAAADAANQRWLRSFPESSDADLTEWITTWQREPALNTHAEPSPPSDHFLLSAPGPSLAALLIGYPKSASDYPSA